MSEYKQRPLASQAKTTSLSDAEYNLISGVQILGGLGYSGGVGVGPFTGAVGRDQIKDAAWISNDRKAEPYAWTYFQALIPSAATGSSVVFIPGIDAVPSPVGVEWSVAYGSITGGANFSGTLNVSVCASALTITNLAALTSARTTSTQTYVAPSSPTLGGILCTLIISTAGITVKDAVITVGIKAKHIA